MIEQERTERPELTYPLRIRFRCRRCAACCRDTDERERRILLLQAEVRRTAALEGIPCEAFALPNPDDNVYTFIMRKRAGRCFFLEGTECSIYQARPLVCRFYPFRLVRSSNGRYVFIATQEGCPGIGQGGRLRKGFFTELFNHAQDVFPRL